METISRKQAKANSLKRYYTGKPCKHGHIAERRIHDGACCECQRLTYLEYQANNVEKERKRKKEWMAEWRDNHDDIASYNKELYQRYSDGYKLRSHIRMKHVRKATPEWVDSKALAEIYKNCPEGYHVDHIIPIKGVLEDGSEVCGLHVPWNLQYLPALENRKKSNKVQPQDINAIL